MALVNKSPHVQEQMTDYVVAALRHEADLKAMSWLFYLLDRELTRVGCGLDEVWASIEDLCNYLSSLQRKAAVLAMYLSRADRQKPPTSARIAAIDRLQPLSEAIEFDKQKWCDPAKFLAPTPLLLFENMALVRQLLDEAGLCTRDLQYHVEQIREQLLKNADKLEYAVLASTMDSVERARGDELFRVKRIQAALEMRYRGMVVTGLLQICANVFVQAVKGNFSLSPEERALVYSFDYVSELKLPKIEPRHILCDEEDEECEF